MVPEENKTISDSALCVQIGVLSLLSRMATIINNMVHIDSQERQTLQSLTEAAILLCSSSSDLQPTCKVELKDDLGVVGFLFNAMF